MDELYQKWTGVNDKQFAHQVFDKLLLKVHGWRKQKKYLKSVGICRESNHHLRRRGSKNYEDGGSGDDVNSRERDDMIKEE